MRRKLLLVGWDAADWKLIGPLMDAGLMPNLQRLVEGGVSGDLMTLSPILSPMLWTSIATGKRPFNHGVLGFTEPLPDDKGVQPVTSLARTTKAIWNILSQNELRSNVVGWWPSSPVEPINGVMVSNHYADTGSANPQDREWPLAARHVHPPQMLDTVAGLRVHPADISAEQVRAFVPLGERIDQQNDSRLQSIIKNISECASLQNCVTHLMQAEPWDFTAVYLDAIDHMGHGFMRYHPPKLDWVTQEDFDIYQSVVTTTYIFHDMMLGTLCEQAGPDCTVMLVSDHGFHPDHLRRRVLPNEPAGPAVEHREHGVFLVHGPGIRKDVLIHGANLLDVTPTILSLFDLPVGEDMDGRPLLDIYQQSVSATTVPSWDDVPGASGEHPPGTGLAVEEASEALEQLVALGYIDRPGDDAAQAAAAARTENNYNLARSFMNAQRFGDAIPLLVTLYEAQPLEFRFGIQLAMCLQALGHVEELADTVADIRQRWLQAATVCRERLTDIAADARERREQHRALMDDLAKAREPTGAVAEHDKQSPAEKLFTLEEQRVIKKLRSIARGNVSALDYMDGWVAVARGDDKAALALLKLAGERQSGAAGYHYQLGECYRRLRRYRKALAAYEAVLALDPHDSGAVLGLAQTYLGLEQYERAREEAGKALALKYHLAPAHYVLGVCEARAGAWDLAREAYARALELNPNYAQAHRRLAGLYSEALADSGLAADHLQHARDLEQLQRQRREERVAPQLPDYSAIDYATALPEMPVSELEPRLGDLDNGVVRPASDGDQTIYVVSGLPRSGTSLMMQMLQAAGLPALTDAARAADENNPRGYLELERVKGLAKSNNWLQDACGKSLKVVSPLLPHLPQGWQYKVIFMQRELDELIASQTTMLTRLGQSADAQSEDKLREQFERHNGFALECLLRQSVPTLQISHAGLMHAPEVIVAELVEFLGLEVSAQPQMLAKIDPSLYRARGASTG
ncbi:tetratricopeptide repeat protein [Halieaceae bacterium IMCC14734]|uniref:Tetratricopeptide repeat protein n=1 Tax=Candidatus Litorirhabdus singularis TaxID=2518993 RepID=A0ABT3TEK8_9GAMM|nr:alkaline phosphatase family protein [Candidatus Litorirhabdus singularis]MCX2979862.1 tetratricopeptide repeat protein [Candidatus Litorirhabdus singularis]